MNLNGPLSFWESVKITARKLKQPSSRLSTGRVRVQVPCGPLQWRGFGLPSELRTPRRTSEVCCRVRTEMAGRGFTLLDTPPFFDDDLFLRLKRRRMVLPAGCKRWWKHPQLARYACWLEGLLHDALPEEAVALVALEFRHEPAGSVDEQVDRLHADGSYLRTVCTPYGPNTIYREGDAELPVPGGHTLLMTAFDRARAPGVPCPPAPRPGA